MGSRCRAASGGFALIIVLFVSAVLMLVVLQFAHSMQVYATVGANGVNDAQLRGALHAGLAVAERLLLDDVVQDVDNEVDMDHLDENWAGEVPPIRLQGASASVTLVDESGKFPLPALVTYQFEENQIVGSTVDPVRRQQLTIVFEEIGLEPDLVDVVVDWLDVDEEPEPRGAEGDDYLPLDHGSRNGPFASIEELELLRGFTHDMVWGDPDDPDVLGLADVCTVTPRPDGRANANTAPEPVLLALVPEEDLARRIESERGRDPFVDDADLNDRVGDSRVSEYLTTASGIWLVEVTATTDHAQRPLVMSARGIVRRTREAAGAADLGDLSAPVPGEAANPADVGAPAPDDTIGVTRVVSWKEFR